MEKKRGRVGEKERWTETIRECFTMVLIMGLKSAFQSVNFFLLLLQEFQALITLLLWDDSLHLDIKEATYLCFCGYV